MPSKRFVMGCVVSVACAVGFACLQRASVKTARLGLARSVPIQNGGNIGKAHIAAAYGNLPLAFEPNQGQAPASVQYLTRGANFTAYLTRSETILALPGPRTVHAGSHALSQSTRVHLQLRGVNATPALRPVEPLVGKVNYFAGRDSAKWHRNIPTYGRVEYQNIYPGIDVAYYGRQNRLEYDFTVAPGANPNEIRMDLTGATSMKLDSSGDLHLKTPAGELIQDKPDIYQSDGTQRHEIRGGYRLLANREIAFNVGPYDHTKPLVIDPVLTYQAFLEPSPMAFQVNLKGVATDSAGNAYATGFTTTNESVDGQPPDEGCVFEAEPGLVNSFDECGAAFVTKLNPAGTAVIYQTLLASASGNAIAVDSAGDAYVAGLAAGGFPATSTAFQQNIGPGNCGGGEAGSATCTDAFVAVLDPSGANINYATYLGGTGNDIGQGIAIDSHNLIYVTGGANANDFPTTPGAFQTTFTAGSNINANFVAKIDPTKSGAASLIYSTFLGGSSPGSGSAEAAPSAYDVGGDHANAIAVNSDGEAYVAGVAFSADIATSGAFQTTKPESQSPFVAKFSATGSNLLWATYLGGTHSATCSEEYASGIAVDASGNAYVTGQTTTSDFPTTPGSFQSTLTSTADAFVTKLASDGSSLVYSALLGGSAFDPMEQPQPSCPATSGTGIALDSTGDAFVTGTTATINFPVGTLSLEPVDYRPTDLVFNGFQDNGFIAELSPSGQSLNFSTYIFAIYMTGIALDGSGGVYVAAAGPSGYVNVPGIPASSGNFIAKVDLDAAGPAALITPQALAFPITNPGTNSPPQTFTLTNRGNGDLDISSIVENQSSSLVESDNCPSALIAGSSCLITLVSNGFPYSGTATLTITDNAVDSPQVLNTYVIPMGTTSAGSLSATSLFFAAQAVGSTSTPQVVTLASQGGAPLNISSIVATGDFAETNSCGSVVAVATFCQISVTFTPTDSGNRTGLVTINDDDPNATARTISLAGVGAPVPLVVSPSSSSQTVTAGSTATYMLQVSATNGFSGSLTVSCSGAPTGAKCNTPSPLTLHGTTPVTETVTVSTTAQSLLALREMDPHPRRADPALDGPRELFAINVINVRSLVISGLSGIVGALLLVFAGSVKSKRIAFFGVGVLTVCSIFCACGGGNGGGGNGGTPAGTYTLHVTFTGGGGTTDLPLKLIVQ